MNFLAQWYTRTMSGTFIHMEELGTRCSTCFAIHELVFFG